MLIEPNQVGKREDLSDLIAVADAKSTPFTTMVKKGKTMQNMLMSWQMDDELDIETEGVADGKDVDSFVNAAENRALSSVYGQKFRKAGMVGDLAENVSDVAGVSEGEMAKTVRKLLTCVKRSMEAKFCSDDETRAQNGSLGYLTRGLGKWIQNSAQAVLPVDANYRTPVSSIDATASTADTDEAAINAVLNSIYEETGQPGDFDGFAGSAMRNRISDLQLIDENASSGTATIRARTVNKDQSDVMLKKKIDIVEGDHGTIRLHTSVWLGYTGNVRTPDVSKGRLYILNMDDIMVRFKRVPGFKELPDLGGGPRGYVDAIAGLLVGNPLNHGKFTPTTA